jgi:UDP-N-acetylglucosamine pyrophosphorylase
MSGGQRQSLAAARAAFWAEKLLIMDEPTAALGVRESAAVLALIQRIRARQILHLRRSTGGHTAFYLMNSFATRQDTLDYLRRYPELWDDGVIDFLQSKVPKIDASTYGPASWPAQPELEWCPPGHGDFYPSLQGSGLLDRLLARGMRYLFVSNSDNLGATADLRILHHFAESDLSFLMEVADRTPSDRKGGHLARRRDNGRLVLRESAQCPKEDEARFQDIERHRFFNTNSLWIRLDRLREELDRHGGVLPLPLIANAKTIDPKDPQSSKVLQLESAMGAAIECFGKAGALVVPRSRFSPVKTTSDLLALRSDAYRVTGDCRLVLDDSRNGRPPTVELDPEYFRVLGAFEERFPAGAPSLVGCASLRVAGNIAFEGGVVCRGAVQFTNRSPEPRTVGSGTYADVDIAL